MLPFAANLPALACYHQLFGQAFASVRNTTSGNMFWQMRQVLPQAAQLSTKPLVELFLIQVLVVSKSVADLLAISICLKKYFRSRLCVRFCAAGHATLARSDARTTSAVQLSRIILNYIDAFLLVDAEGNPSWVIPMLLAD